MSVTLKFSNQEMLPKKIKWEINKISSSIKIRNVNSKLNHIKVPFLTSNNLDYNLKVLNLCTTKLKTILDTTDLHRDFLLINLALNPSTNWDSSLIMLKLNRNLHKTSKINLTSKLMPQNIALNPRVVEEEALRNLSWTKWKSPWHFKILRLRLHQEILNWLMS